MSKLMPLSFSRLSTFEQCEAKFDYLYVSKKVKDTGGEATQYGERVHAVLEAIGQGREVGTDPESQDTRERWGVLVDKILAQPGEKYFEYQMAVNRELQPVDWFAGDVWLRSIADVLIVNGETAYCCDYKTGKVKDNPSQLQLFAAMVMWHFPQVQKVKTSFIWLAHNDTTNATYERRFLSALWGALEPRFVKVQDTVDVDVFTPKPSALCGWCPAQEICPDARPRRKR
jgi:hypothetical protein